jgi:ribosome-associated translation inhibitor RaiA/cold shock CspA family protein
MEKALQITFKQLESSEALERLIRDRVERLEQFHHNIIGCRVVVETPHRGPDSAKAALEITIEITVPGRNPIIGRDVDTRRDSKHDHGGVVTRAFEAVERQLKEAVELRSGDVKRHESSSETGLVVRLYPPQDYGFIQVRGSQDLYFTRNAVVGGNFDDIEVGAMVEVTRATTEGPMGPQASSVRVLGGSQSPA